MRTQMRSIWKFLCNRWAPDLGNELSHSGKAANKAKGSANAKENPSIPINGAIPPLEAASTNKVPTIGPVQEKETTAKAIKKIPVSPPRSACLSTLFTQELGSIISKAPRKKTAKTTRIIKKIRLNQMLVEKAFNTPTPKIQVTVPPRNK